MRPVVTYPNGTLPPFDAAFYERARKAMLKREELEVPPRDARACFIPAGSIFRIVTVAGTQVGDLNVWNAHALEERFYSGKTRALHATHVSTGDRLWSTLPFLRPLATITDDTLDWYGWDNDGAGVHDVIGTRCDPYTNALLNGTDYHYCCHSNLTRAFAAYTGLTLEAAEPHVHDVLNVFMCTGFTRDTHQYFMKASPARPGDYLEMFAEMDLIIALSTCPGGDCSTTHSDDRTRCYPLGIQRYAIPDEILHSRDTAQAVRYGGRHGDAGSLRRRSPR